MGVQPGAESPALHTLPASRWARPQGGPLSVVEGQGHGGTETDICPQLSGPPVLCPTLLHHGVQPSLQPSSPPPSLASLASTGPPQRQLRCGGTSSGTALRAQTEGPLSCTKPSPSFALPSSRLTHLSLPFLLRSHSGECLHVVPLGDTLIPSWTCPLILSSGSESIPTPSLFPGGGKQRKIRFLPSLPAFLCPLVLMKPGLLSLCLDLSGARGSHTAKPTAEAR